MKVESKDLQLSIGFTGVESVPSDTLGIMASPKGFYAMTGREVVPLSGVGRYVLGATGSFLVGDPEILLESTGHSAKILLKEESYVIIEDPPSIHLNFVRDPAAPGRLESRYSWLRITTKYPRMVSLPSGLSWTNAAGPPVIDKRDTTEIAFRGDCARFLSYDTSANILFCLDEAVVSMLCADGSDGKGGRYQLNAIMASGVIGNDKCTWTSSNTAVASVLAGGMVVAVAGASGTVTIIATAGGVSASCSVTVYPTMPSPEALYMLPGGSGTNLTSDVWFQCRKPVAMGCVEVDMSYKPDSSTDVLTFESYGGAGTVTACPNPSSGGSRPFRYHITSTEAAGYYADCAYSDFNVGNVAGSARRAVFSSSVSSPSSIVFNGVTYNSPTGTGNFRMEVKGTWRDSTVNLVFSKGRTIKVVRACGSTSTSVTAFTSQYCSLYYVPQNYIRYTDRPWVLQSDGTYMDRVAYTRIPNLGTLGSTYDLTSNNVGSAWFDMPALSFVCLDEAEVSMLCVDGSDGKGGVFQLHPVFTMDGALADISTVWVRYMTWQSSDPSVATVSSTGLVTAVSNGGAALGKDVTITASYGGLSYSCLVTVYQTMPSATTQGAGLWLCKGGKGEGSATSRGVLALFSSAVGPRASVHTHLSVYSHAGFYYSSDVVGEAEQYIAESSGTTFSHPALGDQGGASMLTVFRSEANSTSAMADYYLLPVSLQTPGTVNLAIDRNGNYFNGSYLNSPDALNVPRRLPLCGNLRYYMFNNIKKSVLFGDDGDSTTLSYAEMLSGASMLRRYSPQNYVRYSDRTATDGVARANYTVIPNMGRAGSPYDLSSNNVPALWYGV